MPCCTYLDQYDYTKPTSDTEINSLLADVRQRTGQDWRVQEMSFTEQRWFRKPVVRRFYTLFSHVSGPEFQIINFYRPDREGDWSINCNNEAGYIAAYFYGLLAARPLGIGDTK